MVTEILQNKNVVNELYVATITIQLMVICSLYYDTDSVVINKNHQ